MQVSGSMRCCRSISGTAFAVSATVSAKAHVLEVERLPVDPNRRRRNPARELAWLDDASHQGRNEGAVVGRGEPFPLVPRPLPVADHAAIRADPHTGQRTDATVEGLVRGL